jgi:hypothetical protein
MLASVGTVGILLIGGAMFFQRMEGAIADRV